MLARKRRNGHRLLRVNCKLVKSPAKIGASGPYMCTPNFVKRGGREKGKKKKRKEEERKEKGGGKFILWQCYDAIVLLVCG